MSEFENEELNAMFDLKKKKKKSKKSDKDKESKDESNTIVGSSSEPTTPTTGFGISDDTQVDTPSYTYELLLQRIFNHLIEGNPDFQNRQRTTMKPPSLMRVGTKKTLWSNFQEICSTMRRSPEHVFQFMMAELGTEGSIDGNKRLVIRGKFVPKYIESLLRKYAQEYVTCTMCRSFEKTNLTKDSVSRLYFLHCEACGSSRSVAPIRAGYHAQIGRRAKK